jgi:hypothetical protein
VLLGEKDERKNEKEIRITDCGPFVFSARYLILGKSEIQLWQQWLLEMGNEEDNFWVNSSTFINEHIDSSI